MKNGYLERVLLKDFGLFSVCIFKRHPDKIYFLAAVIFTGGDFTPTLKAGFRAVTYCFRFWGCLVFHGIRVNKASSIFRSNSTELMLWVTQVVINYEGLKWKRYLKPATFLAWSVGAFGHQQYVGKSAVKGGTGRTPLKYPNVRIFSMKWCISMWSRAYGTQGCGACANCYQRYSTAFSRLLLVSSSLPDSHSKRSCPHQGPLLFNMKKSLNTEEYLEKIS